VNVAFRDVTTASTIRQAARLAGRGLVLAGRGLVLAGCGPDPAPAWQRRWARQASVALATLGAVVAALAILGLVLALRQPLPPPPAYFRGEHPRFLLDTTAELAPLLLAARFPLLAWRLGYLIVLLLPLVPGQPRVAPPQVAVLLIVFCAAGLRNPRPVLWAMWALMLIPAWLWIGPGWDKPVAATLALTAGAAGLDLARAWRRARRELAAQAERAEREHARRAVLEERARIARDLHDVVAHHLSLMAIQAGTAPYRVAGLPDPAREEFASLSQAARAALADMRSLLGVLRSDQPPERAPQPRLADLPELAAAARRAGIDVELSMPDTRGPVPHSAEMCLYRIVQEALSNAGRHAAGAAVTVNVSLDDGCLRLQVSNGPGTPAQHQPNGHQAASGHPGHGLPGMRERVTLLGGTLTAGPAPGGGWAGSAVLPVREPAS
jgi:signal transduction histidine kinase